MTVMTRRRWLHSTSALALAPAISLRTRAVTQATAWRDRKKSVAVRGLNMAYYESGELKGMTTAVVITPHNLQNLAALPERRVNTSYRRHG